MLAKGSYTIDVLIFRMFSKATYYLDNMLIRHMRIALNSPLNKAINYPLFVLNILIDSVPFAKATMKVDLIAQKLRVGVDYKEWVELSLECLYLFLKHIFFFEIGEREAGIVNFLKLLNSIALGSEEISQFN